MVVGTWNKGRENPNKGKKLPPEPLTDGEVKALISACSKRAPTGARNQAMIVMMWRAGLRVSECLALMPKDIDANKSTIRVLRGKGSKARTVGLDSVSFAVIQRWMDKRSTLGIDARRPLFCTLDGKPVQPSYVRLLLPRLARKAVPPIDKRVHPHALRHTMASELRSEGVDIGIISKQLGHSSIATTAKYLDHISPKQVVDTMKDRTWSM